MSIITEQFTRRFAPNCIDAVKLTADDKAEFKKLNLLPIAAILTDRVKEKVDKPISQHQLYHGSPGLGKSTVARVVLGLDLTNKMYPWSNFEALYLNCSKDAHIDVLKTRIENFCTSAAFSDDGKIRKKAVLLDEIDGIRSEAFSDALRGFMDVYEKNVLFIATCNHISRVIPAIKSRFEVINFNPIDDAETKEFEEKYRKRLKTIWTSALKRTCTDEAIVQLALKTKGDVRAGLKAMQSLYQNTNGELVAGNIVAGMTNFRELYDFIFSKPSDEQMHIHLNVRYLDKGYEVLQDLHTQFVDYIIDKYPDHKKMIGNINIYTATYQNAMGNGVDPFLCLKACVFQIVALITKV